MFRDVESNILSNLNNPVLHRFRQVCKRWSNLCRNILTERYKDRVFVIMRRYTEERHSAYFYSIVRDHRLYSLEDGKKEIVKHDAHCSITSNGSVVLSSGPYDW